MNDQKIQQLYRDDAPKYDRERFAGRQGQLLNQHQSAALLKALSGIQKNAPILEVGCGTGRFLEFLEHQGFTDLTGVDQSPEMLVEAAKKTRAQLVPGDVYRLPFGAGSFSAVFSIHVIMHLQRPATALREMSRVSRKRIIVDMNNLLSLSAASSIVRHGQNAWRRLRGRPAVATAPNQFRFRQFVSMVPEAELQQKIMSYPLPLTGPMPGIYLKHYQRLANRLGPLVAPNWASQYLLVFQKSK
ncbi:MAG: class I SAM-dependent methyltransferase [Candidatus Kerfeldbacteria bacterium]|nr:class I SAM-dependent methyltransferase [Candidatus Kerfeldbacteria bacterium]